MTAPRVSMRKRAIEDNVTAERRIARNWSTAMLLVYSYPAPLWVRRELVARDAHARRWRHLRDAARDGVTAW